MVEIMALKAKKLPREFELEKGGKTITLHDPNPAWPVEQVRKFYSATYPELTNMKGDPSPKVLKSKIKYSFNIQPKTKG